MSRVGPALKTILVSTIPVVGAVSSPIALAQQSQSRPVLEEVIVTAQLRKENLQDVPVSVNAVSGDKLLSSGIDKIEDLQSYVPNLTMSETGIGTNIYIRGIGSGINQGFEQSVGMYVDGVSYGRAQLSRAPFLDLQRVEVLRGPQNILFGKNSIAGAISMTTNRPGDEFEGSVSALYEPEYNEQVYDVILSGPVTPDFGARLAYRNRSADGYIKNLTSGKDEPNRDEQTVRLTLDWQASQDLGLTFKYETGSFDIKGRQIEIDDETPSSFSVFTGKTYSQILAAPPLNIFPAQDSSVLNNTQDYRRSSNGDYSNNDTDNYTLTANYALGDNTLTMIAAYMDYDYDELCDCDFTGANLFLLRSKEKYDQSSLELRFTSPTGQTLEYITGLYYQDSNLKFRDQFYLPSDSILVPVLNILPGSGAGDAIANTSVPRVFEQDSTLYSAFLQLTWNIRNDLRLTFGGRYSDEKKDASRQLSIADFNGGTLANPAPASAVYRSVFFVEAHNLKDSRSENDFSPLITGEWDLNDSVMLYASASKGYKSGGFDVRSNASPETAFPAGTFSYGKEKATSFEIGAKTTMLGGAAEVNYALFYTKYDDLQVSIYDGKVGFNVGNAAKADTQGAEIDGRMQLTESLQLTGSLAYLDFEFKDFKNGQCSQGQLPDYPATYPGASVYDGYCDYKGKTNQYVAKWSGNLGLNYSDTVTDALKLMANLDLIFTSDYNPSQTLDPVSKQDGYTKVNARIALGDVNDVWEVALVGKNLTDETVVTYANATPLAFSVFQAPSRYNFYEPPRTVALQGTYRF